MRTSVPTPAEALTSRRIRENNGALRAPVCAGWGGGGGAEDADRGEFAPGVRRSGGQPRGRRGPGREVSRRPEESTG
ncbi:hypothetical protein HPG69_019050 [Diceros bicornis minor]|uniref:Uncharacterized protein n=1 Tax=Diceros bicornis minor TaxID=77932 RepID=A0A7J7EJB1_DICBM|nr:hypothetical protein HPG69_019050 [Diceros bicornis minor]